MLTKTNYEETNGKPKYFSRIAPYNSYYLFLLQYELDKRMYHFGDHFKGHREVRVGFIANLITILRRHLKGIFLSFKFLGHKPSASLKIWSTAYFRVDDHFRGTQYMIARPPWSPGVRSKILFNYKLYRHTVRIKNTIEFGEVRSLMSESFFNEIRDYRSVLKKFIIENNVRAVFLHENMSFFEKLVCGIMSDLRRPTFLFNHGLPYYLKSCDNLSDYFVVWGEAVKRNYVKVGFNEDRILVSGHPAYLLHNEIKLKFEFSDILVLTKSMNGIPFCDYYTLRDRAYCIVYLNMIQDVLMTLGVKKSRFRPHPSENVEWFLKYVDNNFYFVDRESLPDSLARTTLVIGPTSTVFLESLYKSVNYVVFEPRIGKNYTFDTSLPTPPFDGSDERIPCAVSVEELHDILTNKKKVDEKVLFDYVSRSFVNKEILDIIDASVH